MFNVVSIALKRPYTFVVMALLMLITGTLAALRSPVDIFPESVFLSLLWLGNMPVYLQMIWQGELLHYISVF